MRQLTIAIAFSLALSTHAHAFTREVPMSFSLSTGFPPKGDTLITLYCAEPDKTVTTISLVSQKLLNYLQNVRSHTVTVELDRTGKLTIKRIGAVTFQPGDVTNFWTGTLPDMTQK